MEIRKEKRRYVVIEDGIEVARFKTKAKATAYIAIKKLKRWKRKKRTKFDK